MNDEPTRAELLNGLKKELVAYVGFRKRSGIDVTFRQALAGHRQQVVDNLREDTDPLWRARLDLLDALAAQEGLS